MSASEHINIDKKLVEELLIELEKATYAFSEAANVFALLREHTRDSISEGDVRMSTLFELCAEGMTAKAIAHNNKVCALATDVHTSAMEAVQ